MLCMRSKAKVVLLPTADGVHPWSMGMKLEADAMKKLLDDADDTHTRRCVWLQERWPVTSRREVEFNLKKVSRQDEGSNLTCRRIPLSSLHSPLSIPYKVQSMMNKKYSFRVSMVLS